MNDSTDTQPPNEATLPQRLKTPNGLVWTLRHVRKNGEGLYAPVHVPSPPRPVMSTGTELIDACSAVVVDDGPQPATDARGGDRADLRDAHGGAE